MDEDLLPKNKNLLPYAVSTLDPVIKITDLTDFKKRSQKNVEKKVISKMEELYREYQELIEVFDVNKKVLESEIRFEPKQGHIYYLYERDSGKYFLSILSPENWGFTQKKDMIEHFKPFMAVRLNSDNIWEKVDAT